MPHHKTLIFHIGDHKTGSTSIQTAFAQRQVSVEGRKIFYPAGLNMNAMKQQVTRYFQAQTPAEKEKAAVPLKNLALKIRNADADFALISAEALEGVPPRKFKALADEFFADAADEIRVVAYVRPHASRITSSFAERIKVGAKDTLDDTLENFSRRREKSKTFIYLPRFAAWREQFGAAFLLRPMIRRHLHQGDVVSDFIHHAFGGIPFTISGDSQANESLCLEDLMRLKVLQKNLKLAPGKHLNIGWEAARFLTAEQSSLPQTKLRLHQSLAKEIHSTYLDDAQNMDRMFFGGEPLMANELNAAMKAAIAEPQSTEPASYLPASELRSLKLMACMVASLMDYPDADWISFLRGKRVRSVAAPEAKTAE